MGTQRIYVTFWEDDINCVDDIEVEYSDREDFLQKIYAHADQLVRDGHEIAGMRYDERLI